MKNKNKFLGLAFSIGMISLMYEVYIVKVIFLYFTENIYAVSITLSSFLAGLAFSSYYVSCKKNLKEKQAVQLLLAMQIGMIVYAVLILKNHNWIPFVTDFFNQYTQNQDLLFSLRLTVTWIFLLVPALFLGGALPLLTGLFQKNYKSRTNDTSTIYFWDTLGAALGSLLVGIWLIPFFGIQQTFWIILSLNLLIYLGIWSLLNLKKSTHAGLFLFALVIFLLSVTNIIISPSPSVNNPSTNTSLLNKNFFKNQTILWQQNSPFGVVSVTRFKGSQGPNFLHINYRQMCNSQDHQASSEVDIAHNVTKLMQTPGQVLNIGLGCGMTAHSLVKSPKVHQLSVAEINPSVVSANQAYFKDYNQAVLENPKTNLLIKDGAQIIRQAPNQYFSAIVIDIEEPTIIHSSPLFTVDYFKKAKTKLSSDGIFALWFFENPQKDNLQSQKILLNSLKEVFPYVKAYRNPNYNGFSFYASQSPLKANNIDLSFFDFATHIESHPSKEINTINNRVLEQQFDVADYFEIPSEITPEHY